MKRYHLGRKISFICVAKGYPRPNITWMKDGLELDAYAGYEHVSVALEIKTTISKFPVHCVFHKFGLEYFFKK